MTEETLWASGRGSEKLSFPTLQSKMKADPEGYEIELSLVYSQFNSALDLFQQQATPITSSPIVKDLEDWAMFLAHVAPFYPNHLSRFPPQLKEFLSSSARTFPFGLSSSSHPFDQPQDPRDDLSGMDVARKALIITRLLGRQISLHDIKIESLYPDEMGPGFLSVEEFLSGGIVRLDDKVQERVKKASMSGNVLRYVCVIEGSRCDVGLQELSKNSALGRSRGSDNVVEIYSRCYNVQPLVIQGAGAGNDTTAAGVLADILDIQDLFP